MVRTVVCLLYVSLASFLVSCTNEPLEDLSVEDSQVFITNHDSLADFSEYTSFSIVDSVILSRNGQQATRLSAVDMGMLVRLIGQMEDRGFRYVGPQENHDLGISVEFVSNSSLNVIQTPIGGYWGNYWGGFGGWGYGAPSYYSYYLTNENYWSINLLDFANADVANQELPLIWNGQIRGDGLEEQSLVNQMVDNLFLQSPYIERP